MSTVRLRHRCEYAALRAVTAGARALPYPLAVAAALALAAVTYPAIGPRRREAARRMRSVFGPDLSERAARRLAWRAWLNTVLNAVDFLRAARMDQAWLRRHVDAAEAIDAFLRLTADGTGAVLAMPHMGAWELAARAGIAGGLSVFSIAADQKNPLVSAYMNHLREAGGMHILVRGKSTLRQAVRLLRSGRILAILPDLRKPTPGLTVAFLGGAANMADGMAVLARLAHAPIVPCYVLRAGWLRHRVHLLPPVRPDPSADGAADAERMTRAVMAGFDAVIRKHPAQWFWYNKRWVLDPLVNS